MDTPTTDQLPSKPDACAGPNCAPVTGSDLRFEGQYALEEMVRRAVTNARPRDFGKSPRWVAVRDTLAYGSTTSTLLCLHFGLDPHEEIEGWPQPEADDQNAEVSHGSAAKNNQP